jgi:hypothetical protein
MRKPSKCRSCNLNYELSGEAGKHSVVDIGMYCPLCKKVNKWIYHGQHDQLSGDALECKVCHNYILYSDGVGTIEKDEIYFSKNYCLIRDLEKSKSYFSIDDKRIFTFPYIVIFSNPKDLFNKLKTIVVLS